jgi:hypothetical protein
MDSAQPPQKCSNFMGLLGTILGILIGFLGGVYVGLHPQWIPIKGIGTTDESSQPVVMPAPASQPTTQGR